MLYLQTKLHVFFVFLMNEFSRITHSNKDDTCSCYLDDTAMIASSSITFFNSS